jgi:hypothetical protein
MAGLGTGGRRSLELLANILGAVVNLMAAFLEVLGVVPPGRRRAKSAPTLPEGTILNVVAALKADEDAAAHLPRGWRGFYSSLIDEASPDLIATVPTGAPLQLIPAPGRSGRHKPIPVVIEQADRSTIRIGDLARRPYHGDGIDLGRVLSWFAKRERTLLDGNAAVIFVAVCDL